MNEWMNEVKYNKCSSTFSVQNYARWLKAKFFVNFTKFFVKQNNVTWLLCMVKWDIYDN